MLLSCGNYLEEYGCDFIAMDRTTKIIFTVFTTIVILLMHWNIRKLSQVNSDCIMGHDTTLNYLDDFKTSILHSDLLVSFVDKSDLLELQKAKKDALRKVSQLTSRLKSAQIDLVSL